MQIQHPQKSPPDLRAFFVSAGQPVQPSGDLRFARWLGCLAAAIGGVILTGWIAGWPLLKSLFPGQVEAKANTAIAFILAGMALTMKSWPGRFKGRHVVMLANSCAGLTTLMGLATLGEYVLGWKLGIDELFFRDPNALYTVDPGRMALPAALSFLMLGMALLLLEAGRDRAVVSWLVVPSVFLAGQAFVGQLYGLPLLASLGPFTPIAAPTGLAFLILCVGVLLAGSSRLVALGRRSGRMIGLLLALLLLVVMGGAVLSNTRALISNSRQVVHTYEVLDKLAGTLSAMQDVETGSRGYVLTGDPRFLEPYLAAPASLGRLQQDLRSLTADNPAQQLRLDRLARFTGRKLSSAQRAIALREHGDFSQAQATVVSGEGRTHMDAIRQVVSEMRQEENRLLQERQADAAASTQRTLLTLGLGLAACCILLLTIFTLLRREIIRRIQTESALGSSEENLAVTLHSIGDAVLATNTQGQITLMNRVAEQLTGWALAEARGRPVAEVFRIINEETRQPALIPVDRVLATGETHGWTNSTMLVARDGAEHAIADSAAPIRDSAGRVLGAVLVFRDVTELRRSEEELHLSETRYRALFSSIDEGFCVIEMIFDENGIPVDYRFLEISPSFEKQTGMQDALGKRMREIAPLHEAHWFEIYGRIALSGEPARFQNHAAQLHRWFDVYAFRFGKPENRQVAILFNDITHRRQAEMALGERTAQLEAANRELESFSYSVSHDLRAPLRHVQGYVEMLTREVQGSLSDNARRYLKTISDAGREMGELIDDLLAFSRMGRAEMREAPVDLADLVADVQSSLDSVTTGRDVRWKIDALPAVKGDAAMLRQVLANLLGNAAKYTRRREIAEIEIGRAGQEAGRIIFFVRDNGAGFDMRYVDKLFGVFQRLHHTDEFEGTGIGLASVRRIIARHGGRTWADGRVNAGATFYFTLEPAAAGLTQTHARHEAKKNPTGG